MAPKKVWSLAADVALLAWVDFCLESHLDFKDTIVHHLDTVVDKQFTKAEVNARLKQLWETKEDGSYRISRNEGPEITNGGFWQALMKGGSQVIEGLTEEMQRRIRRAVNGYRSMLAGPSHQPTERMASKEASKETERVQDEVAEDSSTPRQRTEPQMQQDHTKSQHLTSVMQTQSTDTHKIMKPHAKNANDQQDQRNAQHSATGEKRELRRNSGKGNSIRIASKPQTARNGTDQSKEEALSSSPNIKNPAKEKLQEIRSSGITDTQEMARQCVEIRMIRDLWARDEEMYLHREEELRNTIHRLEAEKSNMELARMERDRAAGYPYEEANHLKIGEIWSMSQRLQKIAKNSIFAELGSGDRSQLDTDDIDKAIKTIQFELESITCGHTFQSPLLVPKMRMPDRMSDLGSLIRSVLGIGVDDRHLDPLKVILGKFDPGYVIRMFVVAALRDWVFMSDFPNFAPADDRFRYLQTYRQIVLDIGGWSQLYNFDAQAYRNMIDSAAFQRSRLPKTANDLAARLSQALHPFFVQLLPSGECCSFHTWGEEKSIWEARRDRLVRIFDVALVLKANSVITDDQYMFLIYPPGTSLYQASGDILSSAQYNVYWKLASFEVYEGGSCEFANSITSAVVKCRNFVSKGTRTGTKCLYSKPIIEMKGLMKRASTELPSGKSRDAASPKPAEPMEQTRHAAGTANDDPFYRTRGSDISTVEDRSKASGGEEVLPTTQVATRRRYSSALPKLQGIQCSTCDRSFKGSAGLAIHCGHAKDCEPYEQQVEHVEDEGNKETEKVNQTSVLVQRGIVREEETPRQTPTKAKCDDCGSVHADLSALSKHRTRDKYGCADCSLVSCRMATFRDHQRTVHPDEEPPKDPLRIKRSPKRKEISTCEGFMKRRRIALSDRQENESQCPFCAKSFSTQHTLNSHTRKIHDRGPVWCRECGQNFCTEDLLEKHSIDGCSDIDSMHSPSSHPNNATSNTVIGGEQLGQGMQSQMSSPHDSTYGGPEARILHPKSSQHHDARRDFNNASSDD